MKICTRCGKELQDNEQFCTLCGGNKFRPKVQPQQQVKPQPVRQQPRQMQPQVSMPQPQMNMPQQQVNMTQQQMNMQNQQQMMPQQQVPQQGKKLFKSRAEKKAQMQQEIAMMKQMQQQNNDNGMQGQQQQRAMQQKQITVVNQGQQPYNEFSDDDMYDLTVKDWIITLLFMLIPIYNIVYVIKGIRDYNIPDYKRNFFKAYGIYYLSALVLSIIIALVMTLLGI